MSKKVSLHCKCGRTEHEEKLIDGIPTIICECGETYYTASALRLIEEKRIIRDEQSAALEA